MAKTKKPALNFDQFFGSSEPTSELDFLLGAAPEETAALARQRGLPLLDLPIAAIAPDPQQLRHLPLPDNLLRMEVEGDRAAGAILAGLRELGQSMREHGQIQPAIVYADTDPQNPAITHRLLHGQRRWSAAQLADLPTLWVVELPKPTNLERLLRQFEENERREGLTDMERAWSLTTLKEALQREAGGDVPWSVVEERLHISESRRQDLLRLLRFSRDGQAIIQRYGWSEWALRELHMAVSAGEIDQRPATDILREFAGAGEITSSYVTSVVEEYRRQAGAPDMTRQGSADAQGTRGASRAPAQSPDIVRRVSRLRRGVEQVQQQVASVSDDATRALLIDEIASLLSSLQSLLQDLAGRR